MRIMSINNNASNCKKSPAFESLHLNQKSIYEAERNVFEGVRLALTPKEGKLLSEVHELAEKAEIIINVPSQESHQQNTMDFIVTKLREPLSIETGSIKTKNQAPEQIAEAIITKLTEMYSQIKRK